MTLFATSCEPLLTWVVSLIAEGLFVDSGAYTWEQRHRNQAPVWGGRLEQEKAVLTVLEDVLLHSQAHQFHKVWGQLVLYYPGASALHLPTGPEATGAVNKGLWEGYLGFEWEQKMKVKFPIWPFFSPSLICFFHQQPSVPLLLYSPFSTHTPNSPFPPHLQIPLLYPITPQLSLTHVKSFLPHGEAQIVLHFCYHTNIIS